MTDTTIKTLAEVWPDHAGHDIRYSEHGRTDYRLIDVEAWDDSGDTIISSNNWDAAPIDGDIIETETWCATCGQVLPIYFEGVATR